MSTPDELWNSYRDFVYEKDSVSETEDRERKRAFLAGSETVFKLLDNWVKLDEHEALRRVTQYRKLNREAAMETVEEDEQEENLNN